MATSFVDVYNRFLDQVTDDLYIELTPEDTVKDLRNILINAIPAFEFPRKNLLDYTLKTDIINEEETNNNDFVIGVVFDGSLEPDSVDPDEEEQGDDPTIHQVMIERSTFAEDLTAEEILILSKLMMDIWLQRQITSIENTRMKYSGVDFKLTSQANHLSKLLALQDKVKQQAHHYQRLYKRRRFDADGRYESNWDVFKKTNYWYDD